MRLSRRQFLAAAAMFLAYLGLGELLSGPSPRDSVGPFTARLGHRGAGPGNVELGRS